MKSPFAGIAAVNLLPLLLLSLGAEGVFAVKMDEVRSALKSVTSCKAVLRKGQLDLEKADSYNCMFIEDIEDIDEFEIKRVGKVIGSLYKAEETLLADALCQKWVKSCEWSRGRTSDENQELILEQLDILAKSEPRVFMGLVKEGSNYITGSLDYVSVLGNFRRKWKDPIPEHVITTLFKANDFADQEEMCKNATDELKHEFGKTWRVHRAQIKSSLKKLLTRTWSQFMSNLWTAPTNTTATNDKKPEDSKPSKLNTRSKQSSSEESSSTDDTLSESSEDDGKPENVAKNVTGNVTKSADVNAVAIPTMSVKHVLNVEKALIPTTDPKSEPVAVADNATILDSSERPSEIVTATVGVDVAAQTLKQNVASQQTIYLYIIAGVSALAISLLFVLIHMSFNRRRRLV